MIKPDTVLIDYLRKNFSHENVVTEFLKIVQQICDAVGVTITTEIVAINKKKKVDSKVIMGSIPKISSVLAAIYAGSSINPDIVIEEHYANREKAISNCCPDEKEGSNPTNIS